MIRVHGMHVSGNCYKVRLLLELLKIPYQWIETDLFKGETHTEQFLARNPNGKVPLLELDDGRCLAESNAILCFLGEGTQFWPDDAFERAKTLQWLFFEQYSHEPYIAVARFIKRFLAASHPRRAELPNLHARGMLALSVMERHLDAAPFFVGGRFGLADIALYAYTHCAEDGGFDLSPYPALRDWLARVEDQPGFVAQLG
jgi:glutathione S-transferase